MRGVSLVPMIVPFSRICSGMLLANPLPEIDAIPAADFDSARQRAEFDAVGVTGARLTPFLLKRIAELLGPRVLDANRKLIVNNARLAAEVACSWGD